MEVMPQPRSSLEPSCSPLRQLSSSSARRGPVTLTGAEASTRPRGQDSTAACRGPKERGGLAKVAPGAGNSFPSPSSSSAAASAAAFA